MLAPATTYTFLGNFAGSNPYCPLSTLNIEPVSGGTITNSEGSGVVSIASSLANSNLIVSIPSITVLEHTYTFRVSSSTSTGAQGLTDVVKILMTDCSYNVHQAPAILANTPGETFLRMFTSDPSLNYVLPQFTSASPFCTIVS